LTHKQEGGGLVELHSGDSIMRVLLRSAPALLACGIMLMGCGEDGKTSRSKPGDLIQTVGPNQVLVKMDGLS
jgi:hypothetical protein